MGPFILTISIGILTIGIFTIAKKRREIHIRKEAELFAEHVKTRDIKRDLNALFQDGIVYKRRQREFKSVYSELYEAAVEHKNKLDRTGLKNATISGFIDSYDNIDSEIDAHNERLRVNLLMTHKDFFDHCLTYPLDEQQRRSIISEEENCLVVSSAGSGKTSSIVGKVKYLTEVQHADPRNILLISYTRKAAAELTERIGTDELNGYTFHKLAMDIISGNGKKPTICDSTDRLFVNIYHELTADEEFRKNVIKYFLNYQLTDIDERQREHFQQLSDMKLDRISVAVPDMNGGRITVRSEQENKICLALTSLGVKFLYEEPYEYPLDDEMHSQYRPDFSIYYLCEGKTKRIYLEHFGVDRHGLVPQWFAQDAGITYDEACRRYNDGITWKKAAHEKFGTVMLSTSSEDFARGDIQERLTTLLTEAGVPIKPLTTEEFMAYLLPKDSAQEKSFIRLLATFATLLKSSCRDIDEVIRSAVAAGDSRNEFTMKHIFRPVIERYTRKLIESGQIDFTDAILQATEICRKRRPVNYTHIIVDEFQDISLDRYRFLLALRGDGVQRAKLYCVGDDWQSIYRFSGSDMSLFNEFPKYFGPTEICKIETTYRFGQPLVGLSSRFIQKNSAQIKKSIQPFDRQKSTSLEFVEYSNASNYCEKLEKIIESVPAEKSIFLMGRYTFDDNIAAGRYPSRRAGNKFFYAIGGRQIEFLTAHSSKGLEADYVILLKCNKDHFGFPSLVSDDSAIDYLLNKSDKFPFAEERRLFYVAITRAKCKTFVLYNKRHASVFVEEFIHADRVTEDSYKKHPNAQKKWTRREENYMLAMRNNGCSIREISQKLGRSQTAIVMRLGKRNNK